MAASPYIQVAGYSHLLVGFKEDDYAEMHPLGMQIDDTEMVAEQVLHDVPGDSGGGPQGDPIEQQILAVRYRVTFNLSKWSPTIYERLLRHNVMAIDGSFADSELGSLLLRDRSLRFVVSPTKANTIPANDEITGDAHPEAGKDWFYRNFPCCTITTPIRIAPGTKFSTLQFQMRAWRVPQGHVLAPAGTDGWKSGLIWNRGITGVADTYLPESMQVG